MRRLPALLIAVRAVLGPTLLTTGLLGGTGPVLAFLLFSATLTDVFDGMIARRLGVATERLRRADSFIDTVFYLFAALLLMLRYPAVTQAFAAGLLMLLALYIMRALVELRKYGRQAAYHMWSARAWGALLLLGFAEVFLTGQGGWLFAGAIASGVVANVEALAATLLLPTWHHDVPSFFHARRLAASVLK